MPDALHQPAHIKYTFMLSKSTQQPIKTESNDKWAAKLQPCTSALNTKRTFVAAAVHSCNYLNKNFINIYNGFMPKVVKYKCLVSSLWFVWADGWRLVYHHNLYLVYGSCEFYSSWIEMMMKWVKQNGKRNKVNEQVREEELVGLLLSIILKIFVESIFMKWKHTFVHRTVFSLILLYGTTRQLHRNEDIKIGWCLKL